MQKELKYNGYTAQPSDYECQDGDLAAVLNLISEKKSIKPIPNPKTIFKLENNSDILFIHKTNKYCNYITSSRQKVVNNVIRIFSFIQADSNIEKHFYTTVKRFVIRQINSIGNTLLFITTEGIYYFLWKDDENNYIELGNHIPEIPISFGLKGEIVYYHPRFSLVGSTVGLSEEATINKSDDQITNIKIENRDDILNVTNLVLADVNKFISNCEKEGRFTSPFFIRYAYRLFDGNLIMHSAPVFMECSNNYANPFLMSNANTKKVEYFLRGAAFDLDYQVDSQTVIEDLKKWSDIVKSVDIFISSPIYKYKQSGEVDTIIPIKDEFLKWRCVCMRKLDGRDDITKRYQLHSFRQLEMFQDDEKWHDPTYLFTVKLPQYLDDEYFKKVQDCSTFYLLKSINIDDLTSERTTLEITENYLSSLETREAMTDDYDSHTSIIANNSYVYNSRLNLCGLSKKLYEGFDSIASFCHTDGYIDMISNSEDLSADYCDTVHIYIYVKKEGRVIIVKTSHSGTHAQNAPLLYYYYPDSDAYQAVFEFTSGMDESKTVYSVPLKKHEFLNGAFFYDEGKSIKEVGNKIDSVPVISDDMLIEIENKIYTSEINNPFLFPVLSISTIGSGRVIGLASAAKALSEGQFGQFPMYAFCSDGVWALEVSLTTGAFSSKQPITRDVCINAKSITQIDSAVLFVTKRGILLLSGSETQCISDSIDNNNEPYDFSNIPFADEIKTIVSSNNSTDFPFPEKEFVNEFLMNCQIIYAYTRQQIIVFNPNYNYAYVYSLESKMWGIIQASINAKLNSYPEAYAVRNYNEIIDYSQEGDIPEHQFLLTRPIKLDASLKDVNKTIDTIITRGNFARGHVKTVLYGSRDLHSWFPIYTSVDHFLRHFRGTPYKYFRIALICSLTHDESIWGSSISYTPKLTNQPR